MNITYSEYLKQKEDGSWKDIIQVDAKMIQSPSEASFVDELTFYKDQHAKMMVHHTNINMPIYVELLSLIGRSGGAIVLDESFKDEAVAAIRKLKGE